MEFNQEPTLDSIDSAWTHVGVGISHDIQFQMKLGGFKSFTRTLCPAFQLHSLYAVIYGTIPWFTLPRSQLHWLHQTLQHILTSTGCIESPKIYKCFLETFVKTSFWVHVCVNFYHNVKMWRFKLINFLLNCNFLELFFTHKRKWCVWHHLWSHNNHSRESWLLFGSLYDPYLWVGSWGGFLLYKLPSCILSSCDTHWMQHKHSQPIFWCGLSWLHLMLDLPQHLKFSFLWTGIHLCNYLYLEEHKYPLPVKTENKRSFFKDKESYADFIAKKQWGESMQSSYKAWVYSIYIFTKWHKINKATSVSARVVPNTGQWGAPRRKIVSVKENKVR